MKKIICFVLIGLMVLTIVGCANDASDSDKKGLIKVLKNNGYLEKEYKRVGESRVHTSSFDATAIYTNYDVYGNGKNYYSFRFDKAHGADRDRCDFIVYMHEAVFVKDYEIVRYNSEKQAYENIVEDAYVTNELNYKKYCGTKTSKLFGLITNYDIEEY